MCEIQISIIVPVFNVERYLCKCIDSILNQTFDKFELILVDDGSQDTCPQICDNYAKKDDRVKVIHKKNGGQGSARNMGLDIAKGEYIGFVDSDDYIEIDMYQKMINAIKKNEADLAICGYKKVQPFIRISTVNYFKEIQLYSNKELMKKYISTSYIQTVIWNKLYKKELFKNLRFPEIRAREDAYILHEILGRCNKAVQIGECLYIQQIRKGSTENSKFSLAKMSLLDCAIRLQEYIKNNYNDLYYLVAFKASEEKIILMEDIIRSFKYSQYKNTYKKLQKGLVDDSSALNNYKNCNLKKYNKIVFIIKYNYLFKIGNICNAILRNFKDLIKRILYNFIEN